MRSTTVTAVLLGLLASATARAVPILTLNPPGISGNAGDTVGWGFTITNTTNFVLVTSTQFCAAPVTLPQCTPSSIGTYTDYSALDFFVVGPSPESTSVSRIFVDSVSGVGSIHINPGAIPGTLELGQIVLTYDVFTVSPNDPNFDPDTDSLLFSQTLSANASIAVTVVPEPATLGLAVASLLILGAALRTRRH